MGKSIRSKKEKALRSIKRKALEPREDILVRDYVHAARTLTCIDPILQRLYSLSSLLSAWMLHCDKQVRWFIPACL